MSAMIFRQTEEGRRLPLGPVCGGGHQRLPLHLHHALGPCRPPPLPAPRQGSGRPRGQGRSRSCTPDVSHLQESHQCLLFLNMLIRIILHVRTILFQSRY